MIKLWLSFFLLALISCDTVEEEFLYDKTDDEYALSLALELSECVDCLLYTSPSPRD